MNSENTINIISVMGGGSNYTYSGNEKYITTYAYGDTDNAQIAYNRGRLGDATSEVVKSAKISWYSDYAYLPYSNNSWFTRGGYYSNNSSAGIFYSFYGNYGDTLITTGARASLVVFPS